MLSFAQQLFNFKLERYRTRPVSFLNCFFLFNIPVDQRVLDFCGPGFFPL